MSQWVLGRVRRNQRREEGEEPEFSGAVSVVRGCADWKGIFEQTQRQNRAGSVSQTKGEVRAKAWGRSGLGCVECRRARERK